MSEKHDVGDCAVIHQEILTAVEVKMLPDDTFEMVSMFFKVIGDKTRLRILWALDNHEMCVCDIANLLGMTTSAISHQLGTLRKANLVRNRKVGKTVFYSLADDHVKQMLEAGVEHVHD